ncbi:MAG: helix-turn-helix domain-containing protein [candidate division NC10 bacterium]|nr:helix-turn-helix domain-containing protein [candidate division NC10 bacterium]
MALTPHQSPPPLLTSLDVAELLKGSVHSVRSRGWRHRVGLPEVRIGRSIRFREADVRALISRGMRNGGK